MDIQTLKSFFLGCSVINGALLSFWMTICVLAPDLVYRTQHKWFPIPRETFNIIIYSFVGG